MLKNENVLWMLYEKSYFYDEKFNVMVSSKVILFKGKNNKKSDGSYPLAIRIIKNRKAKYIFLGTYVKED
jgi:hypothetical protein